MNNWMVTVVEPDKEEGVLKSQRLIGIYPTYQEAKFISHKINTLKLQRDDKLIKIEETTHEATSTTVGEHIKQIQ